MGKLRNATSDLGKFVQWVGRKCRNHHPLEELNLKAGEKRPNIYKAKTAGCVFTAVNDETLLFYREAGRVFMLKAEEASEETLAKYELQAVGY